jgi:hypothetical protein
MQAVLVRVHISAQEQYYVGAIDNRCAGKCANSKLDVKDKRPLNNQEAVMIFSRKET